MKSRIILLLIALFCGILNASLAHYFYVPIINILLFFAVSILIGYYFSKNIYWWVTLSSFSIFIFHILIVMYTNDTGYYYSNVPGSFIFAIIISLSGFFIGRVIFLKRNYFIASVFLIINIIFFYLSVIYPAKILDSNQINFKIPMLLHLSDSMINKELYMCCGTCRVAMKKDLYTWNIDNFSLTDTMTLCLHFHTPIEYYYLSSYHLFVTEKSDTLIMNSFKFSTIDSTTLSVRLKEVTLKREKNMFGEPSYFIEPNDYTAEEYELFGWEHLLSIPHYLTIGVL